MTVVIFCEVFCGAGDRNKVPAVTWPSFNLIGNHLLKASIIKSKLKNWRKIYTYTCVI